MCLLLRVVEEKEEQRQKICQIYVVEEACECIEGGVTMERAVEVQV